MTPMASKLTVNPLIATTSSSSLVIGRVVRIQRTQAGDAETKTKP